MCETASQLVVLPLAMYSGFSRLASMREIKTNYMYASIGQEIILHQLPLLMLITYNDAELEKSYDLDTACVIFGLLHFCSAFVELIIFRFNLNQGVNLEQRIQVTTVARTRELWRLFGISVVILLFFVIPGYYGFEKQNCKKHFFEVDSYECHDCKDYHGDECLMCADESTCTQCIVGHFLEEEEPRLSLP